MRRLLPLLLAALLPAIATAQERPKVAKPELPETGFASVRLAMRSIPTVKVTVNGAYPGAARVRSLTSEVQLANLR